MVLRLPRLVPKEEKFFDLLKSSAKNLLHGAGLLKELVHNYTDVEKKVSDIKEIESKGDTIIHEVIESEYL